MKEEKDLVNLSNETTQKLFKVICKIAFDKVEGVQEQVDFCIVVATNLLGNMTIQHSPPDMHVLKVNATRVVEHLNEWFNLVIKDLETKKKAN